MRYPVLFFLLCLNLVPPQELEAQQRGYRISGNQIIVNSSAHWGRWTLPTHAVDIITEPQAGVKPHFSRSRFNVLEDVETFTRQLSEFKRKKRQTAILTIDSTET